jgi:hypothetical protein
MLQNQPIKDASLRKPQMLLERCPKCNRNRLFLERDSMGTRKICLCGFSQEINEQGIPTKFEWSKHG